MLRKLRWRTVGVILTALVLAGGGAGVAYAVTAQVTPSSDVITACVNNVSGTTRIVSTASQCRSSEHAVELAASQAPRTVSVDCNTGGSIGQTLAAEPVLPPLTIDITGTCTESVHINRDNVTLRAATDGAGIKAPTSQAEGDTALSVHGTHISLQGLTLTGGFPGLEAFGGASITAEHLHVTGARFGIALRESASAILNNVTVDGFSEGGINIGNGASANISSSEITGTGAGTGHGVGIQVSPGGHALIYHVHVTDCGENGVQAAAGIALINTSVIEHNNTGINAGASGHLFVVDSVIDDNHVGGVANPGSMFLTTTQVAGNRDGGIVSAAANLDIGQGNVIKNNGGYGVDVVDNGVAQIYDTTIEGNSSNGVNVGDTSMVDFREGTNTIADNGGLGVFCEGPPAVAMVRGNPGTLTGNNTDSEGRQNNCPTV